MTDTQQEKPSIGSRRVNTKRFFGLFLMLCGALVCLMVLAWLVSYFIERGVGLAELKVSFTRELLWWAPVTILAVPGILMIHHARRILKHENLSVFSLGEIAILFAIVGIIAAMVLPPDNFSYVAASIVIEGMETATPVQRAVENHYSEHGKLPGNPDDLALSLPDVSTDQHIETLSLGESGRIIITFDTRDIDWGWSWWHGLFLFENNDMTGKTLILVPVVYANTVTWDECNAGTVPKRNRLFKCSGHK